MSCHGVSIEIWGDDENARSVLLDNARLHAGLGWQANAELPDGVAQTWKWLKAS